MIIVEFADSFGEALEALEEFMLFQDGNSALRRVENLQQEIGRFIDLVKKHPRIGRVLGVCQYTATNKCMHDPIDSVTHS